MSMMKEFREFAVRLRREKEEHGTPPTVPEDVVLLREIRDALTMRRA